MTIKTALLRETTNKGNKMRNRFRIEIYDANKLNDLTIYSEQGVDKEYLTELVFSNLRRFNGTIRAYVYDNLKKMDVLLSQIQSLNYHHVSYRTKAFHPLSLAPLLFL